MGPLNHSLNYFANIQNSSLLSYRHTGRHPYDSILKARSFRKIRTFVLFTFDRPSNEQRSERKRGGRPPA